MNDLLIKATQVIGLPVYSDEGKRLDKVEDIIYDPNSNQVKALVVDEGGIFSDSKVILMTDVKSIGKDVVLVENEEAIKKLDQAGTEVSNIARENAYMTKTKVITEEGEELGMVSDLLFNPEDGKVEEVEVSQGVFNNVKSGKKYIKTADILKIGQDATIVRFGVAKDFEQQAENQGLKGAVNQAKDMTDQKIEEVKNDPDNQDLARELKDKARSFKDTAAAKVKKVQAKMEGAANSPETSNIVDAAKMELIEAKEAIEPKIENLKGKIEEKANRYRQRKTGEQNEEMKYNPPILGGARSAGRMGGESRDGNLGKNEDEGADSTEDQHS